MLENPLDSRKRRLYDQRIMRQLALYTAFLSAGWLIAVAIYTIYESTMMHSGFRPISTFDYRHGLVTALNYAFPASVGCLLLLHKANQTAPVSRDVFLLCMITCVLAGYLGFEAKQHAYPNGADPEFAQAIWWLPDPNPEMS